MSKYVNEAWYVVFDGTSHYQLLGCDIEDEIAYDSDVEVVSGPMTEEMADEEVEQLNAGICDYN